MTGSGCSVKVNPFTEWLIAAPAAWAARQAKAQEDENFMVVSTVHTGVKRGAREGGRSTWIQVQFPCNAGVEPFI